MRAQVKPEGSNMPVRNRWQYSASAGSVCKAAQSLVVPDQGLNVLVYPQPAAPVPNLVLSIKRHAPRLVALGSLGMKRGQT